MGLTHSLQKKKNQGAPWAVITTNDLPERASRVTMIVTVHVNYVDTIRMRRTALVVGIKGYKSLL